MSRATTDEPVILPPVRRAMTPEEREQAVAALAKLVASYLENEIEEQWGVSAPRSILSPSPPQEAQG